MTSSLSRAGGFVPLVTLWHWRRPEAWMLAALVALPHTPLLYDLAPLFLIAATVDESLLLIGLSVAVKVGMTVFAGAGYDKFLATGHLITWLMYLPAAIMILRRPERRGIENAADPRVTRRSLQNRCSL